MSVWLIWVAVVLLYLTSLDFIGMVEKMEQS